MVLESNVLGVHRNGKAEFPLTLASIRGESAANFHVKSGQLYNVVINFHLITWSVS